MSYKDILARPSFRKRIDKLAIRPGLTEYDLQEIVLAVLGLQLDTYHLFTVEFKDRGDIAEVAAGFMAYLDSMSPWPWIITHAGWDTRTFSGVFQVESLDGIAAGIGSGGTNPAYEEVRKAVLDSFSLPTYLTNATHDGAARLKEKFEPYVIITQDTERREAPYDGR